MTCLFYASVEKEFNFFAELDEIRLNGGAENLPENTLHRYSSFILSDKHTFCSLKKLQRGFLLFHMCCVYISDGSILGVKSVINNRKERETDQKS